MKVRNALCALFMLLTISIGFSGCDKLKDKLFEAFLTQAADVSLTIPVVNSTSQEGKAETLSFYINVDSIIKANTGGLFSINSVNTVEIETIDMIINNADAANNFANFEYGILLFNTWNPKIQDWNRVLGVARDDIKDSYAANMSLSLVQDVNLKDHMIGTKAVYYYTYKARRVTNKALNCTLRVKFKIE
jgi:hypothetical protein